MRRELIFQQACPAIGLPEPEGLMNGSPVFPVPLTPEEQTRADMLWDAIDKPMTDQAVIDLRDELGSGSPEWAALVSLRKTETEQERGKRYTGHILGLVVDFLFNHCTIQNISGHDCLVVNAAKMDEIKALRDIIETEVPY